MRNAGWRAICLALVLAGPMGGAGAQVLTLDQVSAKLQANYRRINTLEGKFEQELWSATQGRVISKGAGEVRYKKPGKMVWQYRIPREHLFLTDGETIWDYAAEDKEAYVYRVKETLYKEFLLGIGDLKKDFELSFHSGRALSAQGQYQLDLIPRDPEERANVGRITLYLDPQTFLVQETETVDALGNRNHIRFLDLKLNPELPEAAFKFVPPKGVKVIKAESPRAAAPAEPQPK